MPRSIRPKLPGTSTNGESEAASQLDQSALVSPDAAAPSKLKRQQTHIACNSCRSARAKCDGKRPCGRCVARAVTECYYEVHEGETRMSSLRKKVTGLEEEVAFLRELIDTGWDASQEPLRLRVRHSPFSTNRDDTSRTQSVTTSDVNTPEDGNESSRKSKKRRTESLNTEMLPWADDASKNPDSSSTDGRMVPTPQWADQLLAQRTSIPYEAKDPYHHSVNHVSDPFQWSNLHGGSSIPHSLPPPAEILPQPFFEQLCALLDTGQTLPSLASGFAERLDDHITILAVTKGWAEVIRTVALDPQWQVLRQVDGYLSFMRPVDRLAALRLIRLQMKSFAATGSAESEEAQSLLPDWAKPTAIQGVLNHPNIVRYVVWPGIRNCLLTHPSLISAQVFSTMLSCIRFVFPDDISPVTTTLMGMLELVPDFEQSMRDLNCWTLTREFVDRYPVFNQAARVFEDHPQRMISRTDAILDGVEEDDDDDEGEEGHG